MSATYLNHDLNQQSYIDYIVTSAPGSLLDIKILDLDINLSDHLLLCAIFKFDDSVNKSSTQTASRSVQPFLQGSLVNQSINQFIYRSH